MSGNRGRSKQRTHQGTLPFKQRGGSRPGAGRKRRAERPRVAHTRRACVSPAHPLHVTVRLKRGLPTLRAAAVKSVLHSVFAASKDRFGFRLIHFSIQSNHLHFIVEADDRRSLSRGMQGLLIRVAKRLNALWSHAGSVFDDHYHDVILKTPRQVRNALAYVLHNAKKHGARLRGLLDTFTSAAWFDGWKEPVTFAGSTARPIPVAASLSWLLTVGWRRRGHISVHESPASPASRT